MRERDCNREQRSGRRAGRDAGLSRAGRAAGLFLLLAMTTPVTQALFFVEGRHRRQIELLMLAFTAYGLRSLLDLRRAPRR